MVLNKKEQMESELIPLVEKAGGIFVSLNKEQRGKSKVERWYVYYKCPICGEVKSRLHNDVRRSGIACVKCGSKRKSQWKVPTQEEALSDIQKLHPNMEFPDFKYKNCRDKVHYICNECELEGLKYYYSLKHGNGCKTCKGRLNSYSTTDWFKMGKSSKRFESYKLYVIELCGGDENFCKVGITFKSIKNRFCSKKSMPYERSTRYVIEAADANDKESCYAIYNLEKKLLKMLDRVQPKLHFKGNTECVTKESVEKHIYAGSLQLFIQQELIKLGSKKEVLVKRLKNYTKLSIL